MTVQNNCLLLSMKFNDQSVAQLTSACEVFMPRSCVWHYPPCGYPCQDGSGVCSESADVRLRGEVERWLGLKRISAITLVGNSGK